MAGFQEETWVRVPKTILGALAMLLEEACLLDTHDTRTEIRKIQSCLYAKMRSTSPAHQMLVQESFLKAKREYLQYWHPQDMRFQPCSWPQVREDLKRDLRNEIEQEMKKAGWRKPAVKKIKKDKPVPQMASQEIAALEKMMDKMPQDEKIEGGAKDKAGESPAC